jgi:outer membrane protein assembly factor BamB
MRSLLLTAPIFALVAACSSSSTTTGGGGHASTTSGTGGGGAPVAGDSVLMHHKNPSRDGVYTQPTFTRDAVKSLHLDAGFTAATEGHTYAQPLFVDGNGAAKDLLIVATEENFVYALDAATGAVVWKKQTGEPVALTSMPCGNIDPFGVTGTPVIDLTSRTLYLSSLTSPDDGSTKQHLVFALSLDDGSTRAGWPLDMSTISANGKPFKPQYHGQRGALTIVNGALYVPYGGLWGDCGDYHGWLVQVPLGDPSGAIAWATEAQAGGTWAPSGVASDGTSVYIATGNTKATTTWAGGEAILRFPTGSAFAGEAADYFAPQNWLALDNTDIDIGGTGPVIFDLPGATPSALTFALGKDGDAYLLDRDHLGGVSDPIAKAHVSSVNIINAAAVYRTAQATYIAFKGNGTQCTSGSGDLAAIKVLPGAPPTLAGAWCAAQNGLGSPMVTTTDGHAEAVVWSVGAEGDGKLHGFDGDTGEEIVTGDATMDTKRFITPIAAKGRIYVAGHDTVWAYTL